MKASISLIRSLSASAVLLLLAGPSDATLFNRGGSLIYDSVLDVTWMANMNANGPMTFDAASSWAAGLTLGGFSDWRLPSVLDTGSPGCNLSYSGGTDCGANVQTKSGNVYQFEVNQAVYSEMAHLFYVTLENITAYNPDHSIKPGISGVDWGLVNSRPFQNMQNAIYWSGTVYLPSTQYVWIFGNDDGLQLYDFRQSTHFAVAVRNGDVISVPEQQTALLMVFGLGALVVNGARRWSRGGRARNS